MFIDCVYGDRDTAQQERQSNCAGRSINKYLGVADWPVIASICLHIFWHVSFLLILVYRHFGERARTFWHVSFLLTLVFITLCIYSGMFYSSQNTQAAAFQKVMLYKSNRKSNGLEN
jgi:hypothetical protein